MGVRSAQSSKNSIFSEPLLPCFSAALKALAIAIRCRRQDNLCSVGSMQASVVG